MTRRLRFASIAEPAWYRMAGRWMVTGLVLAALLVVISSCAALAVEPSDVEVDGCFARAGENWMLLDEVVIISRNPDSPEFVYFTLRGSSSDINASAELSEADWKKIVAAWMACNAAGISP